MYVFKYACPFSVLLECKRGVICQKFYTKLLQVNSTGYKNDVKKTGNCLNYSFGAGRNKI